MEGGSGGEGESRERDVVKLLSTTLKLRLRQQSELETGRAGSEVKKGENGRRWREGAAVQT